MHTREFGDSFPRVRLLYAFCAALIFALPTNMNGSSAAHAATPTVSIESTSWVPEGHSRFVSVSLSGTTPNQVTIPYGVGPMTTSSSSDYQLSASPLIIAPGQKQAFITVTATTDTLIENDETIEILLGSPQNAQLGTSTSLVTIWDANRPQQDSRPIHAFNDRDLNYPLIDLDAGGNLHMRGSVSEHVPAATLSLMDSLHQYAWWILRNKDDQIVAMIQLGGQSPAEATGNLLLKGEIYRLSQPSMNHLYPITNDQGSAVASFDDAGNLYLAGDIQFEGSSSGSGCGAILTASAISDTRIDLIWQSPGVGVTSWEVWLRQGDTGNYQLAGTAQSVARSYVCYGLRPATNYSFLVRPRIYGGVGSYSNEAKATTLAVSGLHVSMVMPGQYDPSANKGIAVDKIWARFNRSVNSETLTSGTLTIQRSQHGCRVFKPSLDSADAIKNLFSELKPGEMAEATITSCVQSVDNVAMQFPFVWRFTNRAGATAPYFDTAKDDFGPGYNYAAKVVVGDLSGDGALDVVVVNIYDPVRVYLNDCSGMLSDDTSSTQSIPLGISGIMPSGLCLADCDRDGRLDVVVLDSSGGVWIARNIGGNPVAFGAPVQIALNQVSGYPTSLDCGDVNGDGWIDLAIGMTGTPNMILFNDASGSISFGAKVYIGTAENRTNTIKLGDVDDNGILDVIAATNSGNTISLNNGHGMFANDDASTSVLHFGPRVATGAIALGDLNNDGFVDAISSSMAGNAVYLNDHFGRYDKGTTITFPTPARLSNITLSDFDGDGNLDAAVLSSGNRGKVYLNDGTATFRDSAYEFGSASDYTADLASADMDGDGVLDLIEVNFNGFNTIYYNRPLKLDFGLPLVLNTNAQSDSGDDQSPRMATDGDGHWLTVWDTDKMSGNDRDIACATSQEGLPLRWNAPKIINSTASQDNALPDYYANDIHPIIASDGKGGWLVSWQSNVHGLDGTTTGILDDDILATYSSTNGDAWTTVTAVNTNGNDDCRYDKPESIATDGNGRWIVVWVSQSISQLWEGCDEYGRDFDLFYSISKDNGTSWSAPAVLNSTAAADLCNRNSNASLWRDGYDVYRSRDVDPVMKYSKTGTWLCAWDSNTTSTGNKDLGYDYDILFSRSTDNGQTWSPAAPLNTTASSDDQPDISNPEAGISNFSILSIGADTCPDLATDQHGVWVAAWMTSASHVKSNHILVDKGTDPDIVAATSTDDGRTWSDPVLVNTSGTTDTATCLDLKPKIETDEKGNWFVVWTNSWFDGEKTHTEIMRSQSVNNGRTWSHARQLYDDTQFNNGPLFWSLNPIILDKHGNWAAAWASQAPLASIYKTVGDDVVTSAVTIGYDWDILYASATELALKPSDGLERPVPPTILALRTNQSTTANINNDPPITVAAGGDTTVSCTAASELKITAASNGYAFIRWMVDGKEGPTSTTLRLKMDREHLAEMVYAGFSVISVSPREESGNATTTCTMMAELNNTMMRGNLDQQVVAYGSLTGRIRGYVGGIDTQILFHPLDQYEPHEKIQFTLLKNIQAEYPPEQLDAPYVWHYTTRDADVRSSATFEQATFIGDTASSVSAIAVGNLRRLGRDTNARMALLVGFNGAPNQVYFPKSWSMPGSTKTIKYYPDYACSFDSLDYIGDPIPWTHTRAICAADLNSTDTATTSTLAPDVVVGNYGEYSYVCRGSITDDHYYRFEGVYRFGSGHDRTTAIAVGDLDGDGRNDIVQGNDGQADVIYLNDGWGDFSDNSGITETTINTLDAATTGTFGLITGRTRALYLADIDLDGSLDIIAGYYGRGVRIFSNDGFGCFSRDDKSSRTLVLSSTGMVTALAAGDFDGNGYPDIAVGHDGAANTIWLNDGQGTWTSSELLGEYNASIVNATTAIEAADLNGDGSIDLAVATEGTSGNFIHLNDGHGSFKYSSTIGVHCGAYCNTRALAAADLDQDGRIDLVTGNADQASRAWMQGAVGGFLSLRSDLPSFVYDWVTPCVEQYLIGKSVADYVDAYETMNDSDDLFPRMATDGKGHWLLAWSTNQNLKYNQGGSETPPLQNFNLGSDFDIVYAMYYDGRNTNDPWGHLTMDEDTFWTKPVPACSTFDDDQWGGLDYEHDYMPSIASDGNGNWAMCWLKRDQHGDEYGSTVTLFVATTTISQLVANQPYAWGTPIALAIMEYPEDQPLLTPKIVCAKSNPSNESNWMISWTGIGDTGNDTEIMIVRGTWAIDDEDQPKWTWNPAEPLTQSMSRRDSTSSTDGFASAHIANDGYVTGGINTNSYAADLATDGSGHWVAVWQSQTEIIPFNNWATGLPLGDGVDVLFSSSDDNGLTWSEPGYVNIKAPTGENQGWDDFDPKVIYSGDNHWSVFWSRCKQDSPSSLDYCTVTTDTSTIFNSANLTVPNRQWKNCPWGAPKVLNSTHPEGEYPWMVHYPIEVATDQNGGITALYSAGMGYDEYLDFAYCDDPAICTYQAYSDDNGKTWSVPERLPYPITYTYSMFQGSYNDTGTPALCMDSTGQAMAVYASCFSYSYDSNLLDMRTSGLWPADYKPPKLAPWEWKSATSIDVAFTSNTLARGVVPGGISRIPKFPLSISDIDPRYPYRNFPEPHTNLPPMTVVKDGITTEVAQPDADLSFLDDHIRDWNLYNTNNDGGTDPIDSPPIGSVAFFHTPVYWGNGVTTITKLSDIGRIDLTFEGCRHTTPTTNVSIWVFKGGPNRYTSADWANPKAWEMLGAPQWPKQFTTQRSETVSLLSNFGAYISADDDPTTAPFGKCENGDGVRRPAGTLTWAVYADGMTTITQWLRINYVHASIVRSSFVNPLTVANSYLNTWGKPDTATTGTLPCFAKPGALNGQLRLDLITTDSTQNGGCVALHINVEKADPGMELQVYSYSSGEPLFIASYPLNSVDTWEQTVTWDYRSELLTTNAYQFEQDLINEGANGGVFVQLIKNGEAFGDPQRFDPDWDKDNLGDQAELHTYFTDPYDRDTDDDGIRDGEEIGIGTKPLKADCDGDHLADSLEIGMTTDTLHARLAIISTKLFRASEGDPIITQVDCESTSTPLNGNIHGASGLLLVDMDSATRTDPIKPDTDSDGFFDGPSVWVSLGDLGEQLYAGEDLNGNGKHEPLGSDHLPDTADDETDPMYKSSHPAGKAIVALDSDADGMADQFEDELGTDPEDKDSDDDGVLDGDEIYKYHTLPGNADSDMDGLPDGFELGLTYSADGTGLNDYNRSWFGQISKENRYYFKLRGEEQVHDQLSFMPCTNPSYRSDPRCIDSDYDGVWDLAEYNANPRTDPMRGLTRQTEELDSPEAFFRLELPGIITGSSPVNGDYDIFLNKVLGDDSKEHWETTLPICLGQSPSELIQLTTTPSLPVFKSGNGDYVSNLTISGTDTKSYMGQYQIKEVHIRCPEPQPGTLHISINRGPGDTKTYNVGLNGCFID